MTDLYIQKLKPMDKAYTRADANGLYVRVLPTGKKTFMTVSTFDGRRRWYKIGSYPELSLEKANEKLREIQSLVEQGVDPLEDRLEKKAESITAPTVSEFIQTYLKHHAYKTKSERSANEDKRILEGDVEKAWGKRKLKNIKRPDVVQLLDDIAGRGAPIMANRTLAAVRKMFNVAVKRGVLEASPCQLIDPPGGNERSRRKERFLSDDEIKSFLTFSDTGITETFNRPLKLILITAQRPGEVAGMRWEEIDGDWWTIPSERTKNGIAHRVYLSAMAKDVLGTPKAKGYVFPSRVRGDHAGVKKAPIHVNAVAQALRKKIDKWIELRKKDGKPSETFTPHDLRRTAASHMGMLKVSERTISRILNHVDGGVTSIYNRYEYDDEKRLALEVWSRKIDNILNPQTKDNVIAMTR